MTVIKDDLMASDWLAVVPVQMEWSESLSEGIAFKLNSESLICGTRNKRTNKTETDS